MRKPLKYQQQVLDILNTGGHLSEDEADRQPFDLIDAGDNNIGIHPQTVKWLFKHFKFNSRTMCVQSNGYAMRQHFINL